MKKTTIGNEIQDKKSINTNIMMEVKYLEISVRAINCLHAEKIEKVSELIEKTENDLLKVRNLGKKSVRAIRESLKSLGFKLKEK